MSVMSVVCCQVEVSALGWSLVQRSPTECGVSECDCEASIMRRPWPMGGCCAMKKKCIQHILCVCYLNEARTVVLLGDVLEEKTEQRKCKTSARVICLNGRKFTVTYFCQEVYMYTSLLLRIRVT
jgi:hypothetical protein